MARWYLQSDLANNSFLSKQRVTVSIEDICYHIGSTRLGDIYSQTTQENMHYLVNTACVLQVNRDKCTPLGCIFVIVQSQLQK